MNKNQVSAREDGMSLLLKKQGIKLYGYDKESTVTSDEIDEIEVYLQDKNLRTKTPYCFGKQYNITGVD